MWRGRTSDTRTRVRVARDGRGVDARPLPHAIANVFTALILVFALICQPYMIAFEGWQIKVNKAEAQAVPAAIPVALAYLEAMAAAAGMSVGDFMLTVGIGTAAITGFNMLEETAEYGAEGSIDGLYGLVTTAEWPEWSTLDESQQESWGSEANYTAAQFNAALSVFGLTESRDLYYSSGGGDLDEGSVSLAQRIGELGTKWADGAITSLSDLYAMTTDPQSLLQGVWPSSFGVQATKSVRLGNHDAPFAYIPVYRTYSNAASENPPEYINPSNWMAAYTGQITRSSGVTNNLWLVGYQSNIDQLWTPDITISEGTEAFNISASGRSRGLTDRPVADSHGQVMGTSTTTGVTWPQPTGYMGRYDAGGWYFNAAYGGKYIYQGEVIDLDVEPYDYDQMPGTDGDIVNGLNYPEDGVGVPKLEPNTPWPTLFGDPSQPSPEPTPEPVETPFNPGNQSGGDQFKEDTDSVFKPVFNLPFDTMFPFCVIWDLGKLMDKLYSIGGYEAVSADQTTSLRNTYASRDALQVQSIDTQDTGWDKPAWTAGHTEIKIPFNMITGEEISIELDVWPLAVVLQWLKPFLQMLFIAGLLGITLKTFQEFYFSGW